MSWYEPIIEILVFGLTPICFVYAWWYYAKRIDHRREWRSITSFLSLVLLSATAVSLPLMLASSPSFESGKAFNYVRLWQRPMLLTLMLAFVLAFVSKPKLIAPLALTALGLGFVWIMTTAML